MRLFSPNRDIKLNISTKDKYALFATNKANKPIYGIFADSSDTTRQELEKDTALI